MKRRAVLASLGAGALAGCTSLGRGETDTGDAATPSPPERIASDWPVPGHDPGRSNVAPDAAGPADPVVELWRATLGAAPSAPVVADGTVYVGTADGVVRALDGRTGAERWRTMVGETAGVPRVAGDRCLVPTEGAVVALDARSGARAWRVETPGRAALLVAPHGVYWLSTDGGPAVVALARSDGRERWRTAIRDPWEPPLFAGEDAVVSTGPHSGRPWRLAPDDGRVVGGAPGMGHDFPEERFALDGTVYAVDAFMGLVVATPTTDAGGWSQAVEGIGTAALSGGVDHVYHVADAGIPGLTALSRDEGTVAWRVGLSPAAVHRPVVARGVVLLHTGDDLRAFAPTDGRERWTRADVGPRFVVADDLLYVAGEGTVRAFRPP